MKKIINLLLANIRKGKGQSASLLIFVMIAALLLNLGLLLMLRFGDFFDKKSDEINSAHFSVILGDTYYQLKKDKFEKYLKNYEGVSETEENEILSFSGDMTYNGSTIMGYLIFDNIKHTQKMNPFKLIEGKNPEANNEICLPYTFKTGGKYKIGDTFKLASNNKNHLFKITGFSEEIMFGSVKSGMYRMYLSDSGYEKLLSDDSFDKDWLLSARMENPADSDKLDFDFSKELFSNMNNDDDEPIPIKIVGGGTYSINKYAHTFISDIISIIMVVFAGLIVLINLIVIWFRIRNSIEEGIINIGVLKSMGYRSSQIIGGINFQFGTIAALGALIGIILSYAVLPLVSFALEQQTALIWSQGFDFSVSLITILTLIFSVLIIAFLSARKIKVLHPLIALRQGFSTHSFKRNYLPLDKSKGSLSFLLALKSSLQNKGQMIMVFIIIFAVSFTATTGVSIFYNVGLKSENFIKLARGEVPDCVVLAKGFPYVKTAMELVKSQSETRKAIYFDGWKITIDDIEIPNYITDDFSLLEGSMLYKGRYPKHDNEIAISGSFSDYSGKTINDTISVSLVENTKEYIIVGLTQSGDGANSMMTTEGMRRLDSEFEGYRIYVYLNDSKDTADFIKKIEKEAGYMFDIVINEHEAIDAEFDVYSTMFTIVAIVILIVTIFVIILVLYLVLKTLIIKRKRLLGIQKSMGFTTLQLMNQIALNYMPIIALAVASGGLLGAFGFNWVIVALMKDMGVRTASLSVPILMTAIMCIGLVIISYLISMLISWRIRKISAYTLVSE